jgi:hypothetical protein
LETECLGLDRVSLRTTAWRRGAHLGDRNLPGVEALIVNETGVN